MHRASNDSGSAASIAVAGLIALAVAMGVTDDAFAPQLVLRRSPARARPCRGKRRAVRGRRHRYRGHGPVVHGIDGCTRRFESHLTGARRGVAHRAAFASLQVPGPLVVSAVAQLRHGFEASLLAAAAVLLAAALALWRSVRR